MIFRRAFLGKGDFVFTQAVLTDLARDQIAVGNGDLFTFGVTRKEDDLHAVAQRSGDCFQRIGRGDEEDL